MQAVTKGTFFSDFCMKARKTEEGGKRCQKCDRYGADKAARNKASCEYSCHAGLVDFAAPIMAGGSMVGCLVGGQVLTEAPDEAKIRKVALEIGVDPDEFAEDVHKIKIVDAATVSGVWLATERTAGRAGERGAAGMFRASQNESSPAAANHASHSGRRQGGRRRFTSFSPAPEKGIRPGARAWRPAPRRGVRPPCPGARRTGSPRPVPVPAARAGLPCSGRS